MTTTTDDQKFTEYLENQSCSECEKYLNLPELIKNKDCNDVIVVNYHTTKPENTEIEKSETEKSETEKNEIENTTLLFCSRSCFDVKMSYDDEIGPIHCVVCDKLRVSPKWDLKIKFEKLGGFLSIRAICSEQCQIALQTETFKDPESEFKMSCWYCRKLSSGKLPRCSKCKVAYYCDQICQTRHWTEGHKLNCESDVKPETS